MLPNNLFRVVGIRAVHARGRAILEIERQGLKEA